MAAITKALLTSDAVMWFQGDHVMVDTGKQVWRYDVPLGVHTNKRKLTFRVGPLIRFTNKGVEVLGTLLRYRTQWRHCREAVDYTPTLVDTPYGVAPRVQLFAETMAKLGGGHARIHNLVDKNQYEPRSLMEAANLDQVVGGLNEKILADHDDRCVERMRREALPKYQAGIK
nr:MAG TPA: hypothetical protein [Caudoviricetes sp.]